jgi:hypothetical protein
VDGWPQAGVIYPRLQLAENRAQVKNSQRFLMVVLYSEQVLFVLLIMNFQVLLLGKPPRPSATPPLEENWYVASRSKFPNYRR